MRHPALFPFLKAVFTSEQVQEVIAKRRARMDRQLRLGGEHSCCWRTCRACLCALQIKCVKEAVAGNQQPPPTCLTPPHFTRTPISHTLTLTCTYMLPTSHSHTPHSLPTPSHPTVTLSHTPMSTSHNFNLSCKCMHSRILSAHKIVSFHLVGCLC